MISTNY